jgi:hypothetical protein
VYAWYFMPPIAASSHGRIFTFSFDRIYGGAESGSAVDHATLNIDYTEASPRYASTRRAPVNG